MKTIVVTGGGTAGHVTPNLALLPALRAAGWHVEYIGGAGGIEAELAAQAGIPFHGVRTGKLRRYFSLRNLSDPFRVIKGASESLKLLKEIKPDLVFSKGGFVSVPVAWAAHKLKIPLILHESDYTPGLANKLLRPWATRICTTFPETADFLGGNAVFTGTPIRGDLLSGDAAQGLSTAGLDGSLPVLLVSGGSQGAAAINEAVRASLDELCGEFQIIHLCGAGKLADISHKGYFQMEYATEELRHFLACASLVAARAGANSIYEFLTAKKPMLLIPLPLSASRGDQIHNAHSFTRQGFARTLEQELLTPETFAQAVRDTYNAREDILACMAASSAAEGIEAVMRVIQEAMENS